MYEIKKKEHFSFQFPRWNDYFTAIDDRKAVDP